MAKKKSMLSICVLALATAAAGQGGLSANTSEATLTKDAVRRVRPNYPEDAIHDHKSGVAVASITVDTKGSVVSTEVLEAPTDSIAKSVRDATALWLFKPFVLPNGQALTMSGKLTFYFEIEDGIYRVLTPKDTGYVGRWSENKSRKYVAPEK